MKIGAIALLLLLSACAGARENTPSAALPGPDLAAMISTADRTRDDGNYEAAMRVYQQVLISDPKQVAAQYGIAECLLALGRADEAAALFDTVSRQSAAYRARGLQGVGLSLLAQNRLDPAENALQKAVAADPSLWRSWNALGDLADTSRKPLKAIEYYARALALTPDSAVVLNNIGYSKLLAGDAEGAFDQFRKALAREPHSATIQNNLRLALAAAGNYAEATRATSPADKPMVLNNVGFMAMQRGDYAAARSYLSDAMVQSGSYNEVAARNLQQIKSNGEAPQ